MEERQYFPALDGVRALAILQVLALHGARSFVPGGFLGVDLFFTLSGYLITSVLLVDHERRGRVDLRRFWARRARRILPPLAVLLVVALLLWQGLPEPKPSLLRAAAPALFYVGNLQASIDASQLGALLHTWSLSTEEQFYVAWPLFLVALLRWPRSTALRVLCLVIALAAASRALLMGTMAGNYYSPLARVDELLVGCALAVVPRTWLERARPLYRATAVVFLAACPWLLLTATADSRAMFAGGFTLYALGAAALLAVASDPSPTFVQRALAQRWLVALGKRSYGVYLFHYPIFLWFEQFRVPNAELNFAWVSAARLGLTLLVAEISYRLVERPFLSPRPAQRTRTVTLSEALSSPGLLPPRSRATNPSAVA
jgi:peptidoglycan/LPS O-acetylase OafA/YrhL